jgi:hypothetical protein
MKIDKNVAALLNKQAYTVEVQYQHSKGSGSAYRYVTDIPSVAVGDFVLVPTRAMAEYAGTDCDRQIEPGVRLSVARVVAVHESVLTEIDDPIEYSWVISVLDVSNYFATKKRNEELMAIIKESYVNNIRASFSQQIFAGLTDEGKARLLTLLPS